MKKVVLIAIAGLIVIAAAGVIVFKSIAAKGTFQNATEVSPEAAQLLQAKVDAVKNAEKDPEHKGGSSTMVLTEAELESYVLYSLKEDIPVQVDSMKVRLGPGTLGAETQLTFTSNATGNAMVDALVGGTHNLALKTKLDGRKGIGKFELDEVRVDGIPVPNVLIQALIKKYVKPKYPEVDLNEPFELPWKIQELKLEEGKATVVY